MSLSPHFRNTLRMTTHTQFSLPPVVRTRESSNKQSSVVRVRLHFWLSITSFTCIHPQVFISGRHRFLLKMLFLSNPPPHIPSVPLPKSRRHPIRNFQSQQPTTPPHLPVSLSTSNSSGRPIPCIILPRLHLLPHYLRYRRVLARSAILAITYNSYSSSPFL